MRTWLLLPDRSISSYSLPSRYIQLHSREHQPRCLSDMQGGKVLREQWPGSADWQLHCWLLLPCRQQISQGCHLSCWQHVPLGLSNTHPLLWGLPGHARAECLQDVPCRVPVHSDWNRTLRHQLLLSLQLNGADPLPCRIFHEGHECLDSRLVPPLHGRQVLRKRCYARHRDIYLPRWRRLLLGSRLSCRKLPLPRRLLLPRGNIKPHPMHTWLLLPNYGAHSCNSIVQCCLLLPLWFIHCHSTRQHPRKRMPARLLLPSRHVLTNWMPAGNVQSFIRKNRCLELSRLP